jgi:hypothetical protein
MFVSSRVKRTPKESIGGKRKREKRKNAKKKRPSQLWVEPDPMPPVARQALASEEG